MVLGVGGASIVEEHLQVKRVRGCDPVFLYQDDLYAKTKLNVICCVEPPPQVRQGFFQITCSIFSSLVGVVQACHSMACHATTSVRRILSSLVDVSIGLQVFLLPALGLLTCFCR
jgi:hypothetical protein